MSKAPAIFLTLLLACCSDARAADKPALQKLFPDAPAAKEEEKPKQRIPVEPNTPDVFIKGHEPRRLAVTAENARGGKRTGTVELPGDSLAVTVSSTGEARPMTLRLREIARIEIVAWRGNRRKADEYLFVPARANIILRDGTVLDCSAGLEFLTRLWLRAEGRRSRVYTWFFDYREKERWRTSGEEELRYPETHPHEETVVKLHLVD